MKNQQTIVKAGRLIHLFYTTRIKVLFHLLVDNKIHYSRIPIALFSIVISLLGSPIRLLQRVLYRKKIRQISFTDQPPLFLVGHFRSGTTHLHTLMSKDMQFGTPTIYHALFINYCLIGGRWLKQLLSPLMPKKRIQDEVEISLDEPDEEEIALFCYSRHNGLIDYFFPRNPRYHNQYILFQGDCEKERSLWYKNYLEVLQIIAHSVGTNQLLLKNPFNTARILELNHHFPGARFVFIIRDPYDMYLSLQHWYRTLILPLSLQVLSDSELEERILDRFRSIMEKYLRIRDELPKDCLVEVRFEALQKDPISIVRAIYGELKLQGLETALPQMEAYLASVKDYRQNQYDLIPDGIVKRINKEWGFVFDQWGYPMIEV